MLEQNTSINNLILNDLGLHDWHILPLLKAVKYRETPLYINLQGEHRLSRVVSEEVNHWNNSVDITFKI